MKKKKRVPWTHISHPSKRLFSLPTPIFISYSHLVLTSLREERFSDSSFTQSRCSTLFILCIIEIWLLQNSFRPHMGKLGTLAPVHRAGEMCPSPVVLGVRASANLMTLKSAQTQPIKEVPTEEIRFQDSSCVLSYPVSPSDPLPKTGVGQHLV